MKNLLFFIALLITGMSIDCPAQKKPFELAIIGETLKDFNLPVYQGGEFQLSNQKGSNVLLIFPRGYYDKNKWCDICAYEYLDLADEFHNKKSAEKYQLDVIIVLPYDENTIAEWLMDIPDGYASLEEGKYLPDTSTNEKAKIWARFANKHYPKKFSVKKGETPQPFKILVDKKHELSERLDIFRTEWWGTSVEQNIPTYILLDKDGTVVFKYISQHTTDRPSVNYLIKVIEKLLND